MPSTTLSKQLRGVARARAAAAAAAAAHSAGAQCLVKDLNERPHSRELEQHAFLKLAEGKECLKELAALPKPAKFKPGFRHMWSDEANSAAPAGEEDRAGKEDTEHSR